MKKRVNISFVVVVGILILAMPGMSYGSAFLYQQVPAKQDTIKPDTTGPYQPTRSSTFQPMYRFGDPISNKETSSPLQLIDPSQLDYELEYDSGFTYSLYERIGLLNFRPATSMTFDEYDRYNDQKIIQDYWQEQSIGLDGESAVSGRQLIPRLYISPLFDRIFGGSYVDIQPTGFVNLDFGGLFQYIDNPQVPERQRRNGGFNFNMQISSNVVGKIGEKLAVTFNFDNNNTFDFQNDMKVDYTGYEEDIIKKIELGNVSMPVSNSLISGAQSLFGIKTQLQFGRLYVTGVASRQRGRNDVITLENGVDEQQFEIRASNYDDNRHFFLGHFFRENYENWLNNLPQIISGVNITRVEIYVLNRNNDTETTRNFISFMDLGESRRIYNPAFVAPEIQPTNNGANNLYSAIRSNAQFRDRDNSNALLESQFGMVESTDYVKVTTARKLDLTEYRINKEMGYVSLMRKLQNDEVLAVAYEYTYNGRVYKVGELTEDYQNIPEDQLIYLKMLRPNKVNVRLPMWDLMMKNIYNLNAGQIQREGFTLRVHYRDDRTGIDNPSLHEGRNTKDIPLLQILKLDQLNQNNDRQIDGNFDYIDDVTIDSRNGNIIFPVLEPFGRTLRAAFDPSESVLIDRYVYDTLYRTTKADAELIAAKNKFFILGKYSGGSGSEIVLPGINIAPNSVVVTAGNTPLAEGLDYSVDYNLGRVRILNQGILSSGKQIQISYEKADLFNFQTRWLTGAQFDYVVNERFNVGATILRLNERPGGITRYAIGEEPTKNTQYGFNINYREDSRFITKAIDALPLISTKEISNITFTAEVAALRPGTSNIVEGKGTSYIDDFESAIIPISLGGFGGWKPASTPLTTDNRFDLSSQAGSSLGVNFRRAKIAWYTVDNSVFYRATGGNRPNNIRQEDLENHYVKAVLPQDIFQQRDRLQVNMPEPVLDIAYFPSERGQYNYNPNLTLNGRLPDPRQNWAGVTRAITNEVDFDKTNVEYLEFWMMDPFIDGQRGRVLDGIFNTNNTTGGRLVFNLGSVSEDLMRDGRHSFENGLPRDGDITNVTQNEWGYVPSQQFLTQYFENDRTARENQDVGLDGLKNDQEREIFQQDFLSRLSVSGAVLEQIQNDPSADDFRYYLNSEYDQQDAKILERYKNYNGLDGNSPFSTSGLTQAYNVLPDNEDLNRDNTISTLEEYYEYNVNLQPGQLGVGNGFIVDQVVDRSGEATWYLFRIPIRRPDRVVGDIDGFKTIRFVRMYLTGFSQPVVLRMAKFQLVGSQWRKFNEALNEVGFNEVPETVTSDFTISVVNIEENGVGDAEKSPYVIPPGLDRDRDNTTYLNRRVNEQSLQICVENLEDKDARAVYKNVSYDLINYGRMKMFFHAEAFKGDNVQDDQVTAFLRFGTDFTDNYYEIEVPLKVTPRNLTMSGDALRRAVWPLENEIDISINELLGLKSARNRAGLNELIPYTSKSNNGQYNLSIKGRPDISTILTMMIGIRNPESQDVAPKSVCIWANELRVTDFDSNPGWAANARMSVKLADLGNFTASTRYNSIGFGSIQQRISERARAETFQYDLSANINLDKFMRSDITGLKVPVFASYEQTRITPQFDPLDPDVPLEASLLTFNTTEERSDYRRLVEDRTTRRSLNFTNVRKEKVNKESLSMPYDISNFSLSYAYADQISSSINTESLVRKTQSGGVAYTYSPKGISIEPFKSKGLFESPYLKLIKDINFSPIPNNFSARADLNRTFMKTQLYNDRLTTDGIQPFYERLFTFNRTYNFRWNLSKGLALDYSARANAIIDETDGIIDGDINTAEERNYVWQQVYSMGRMRNYSQDISANYKLPLDKFPMTDWLSADLRYAVGYNWVAGSLNQNDSLGNFFGNSIQNKSEQTVTGKIDMVRLYNKVDYLKKINTPTRSASPTRQQAQTSATTEKEKSGVNVSTIFLRMLMSIRSVNATYSVRENTTLAGFIPSASLFGMDADFNAPGLPFILGSQDPDIRFQAAENGWLTASPFLTAPFIQANNRDLSFRAAIEPSKDLKIQLDAKRTNTADFREIFRFDSEIEDYLSQTPARSGSYSITTSTFRTAFEKQKNNVSPTYNEFRRNVGIIDNRFEQLLAGGTSGGRYDTASQDVLIPAFLAAYTGQSASNASLKPFPVIPLPNWRVDFAGLNKLPVLKDIFSSINLTHSYRSVYNINNYTNSLRYDDNLSLNNSFLNYPFGNQVDDSLRLVPVYIINQVTIIEQFAPLIGFNLRTKDNLNLRVDFKKDRNLSLNLANGQVTEAMNNDVSMDIGYTKEKLKLPFKVQGRTITIENAITSRMSMTIRDSRTIQRKPNGENIVTNGNRNFQIRPTLGYKLNQSLDVTLYFERSITNPLVGSFRRATTAFGGQIRFNLAQ